MFATVIVIMYLVIDLTYTMIFVTGNSFPLVGTIITLGVFKQPSA